VLLGVAVALIGLGITQLPWATYTPTSVQP
jgi:hypothetical protein